MLQRFSTGLISGEFGGQHVFSINLAGFFFTMPGWLRLRVLVPSLGRTSCGDWTWIVFSCLLLHSHFYGEGQASFLSLICCWCSNRQSKSVLRVKNVSFRPMWFILNFFNLICWRNLALAQTISFFELGSWNKYLGHSSEKRKSSHSSAVRFLYCLANFSRAARCLAVGRGVFCLLSGLQPSLFINLQMVFSPPTWPLLLIVVKAVWSSFSFCT